MAIRTPAIIALIVGLQATAAILILWFALDDATAASGDLLLLAIAGLAGLGALSYVGLWLLLKKTLFQPLASLQRGAEIILRSHASHLIEVPPNHQLGELPELMQSLGDEIANSQQEMNLAMRSGAQKAEALKSRLEQVILGLKEGVCVCDGAARILLYNPAAIRILDQNPALGLGRSLYNLLPQAPIQHTLDILRGQETDDSDVESTDFMCSVLDQEQMLRCRLAPMPGDPTTDIGHKHSRGFVLTFEDVTAKQETLKERNAVLRQTIEKLRGPLANLRAAAETMSAFADMTPEERAAFIDVIDSESIQLTGEVDQLSKASRSLVGGEWVLADIYSSDLINSVSRRLADRGEIQVTMTGIPLWLTVDSHAMAVLLVYFIEGIHDLFGTHNFDVEVLMGNNTIYLDLSWVGATLNNTQLSSWQDEPLKDLVGAPTVYDVLYQIGSEIWSQSHSRLQDHSILRIPLPVSPRQWEVAEEKLPPRPVSYDFDIEDLETGDKSLRQKSLRELEYVVFDTETTGLHIESGDQVIQIGGVRVVNQRILSGETFDQLIHPGRNIPKDSIRFHGITDDMVQDAPPLVDVLPDFKAFVGDAVLVAHNAWFDMPFLHAQEIKAGVRFDNPVLDTLVLSVCLHGQDVDQSLDGILGRLGIEVYGRHSALGDSLATAELLLKLIDMLEARGIVTLQDAINAYHNVKY